MELTEVAQHWRPAPVHEVEVLDPAVGAAAAGIWDQPPPDGDLPPLWHWFHFLDWVPATGVGTDGHPADGVFLPPVDDRRRMFAGGVWRQELALHYGEAVERRRRVLEVRSKSGRSGDLLFVTVRSELFQQSRLCVAEDQDIVYRSGPSAVDMRGTVLSEDVPEDPPGADTLPLHTDPALLFRMSALTANQHRIHYDRPYAVDVEHYPGLVVHGPLLVLHMAELLHRSQPANTMREITFRLRAPAFVGEPLVAIAEAPDAGSRAVRVASAREANHASVIATF